MRKTEFIKLLQTIKKATSISGLKYENIRIENNIILGIRCSTGSQFKIFVEDLYHAYMELTRFTTVTMKSYVKNEASPALAILIEMGIVKDGKKLILQVEKIDDESRSNHVVKKFRYKDYLDALEERAREKNDDVLLEYVNELKQKKNGTVNERRRVDDTAKTNRNDCRNEKSDTSDSSDTNVRFCCGVIVFLIIASGIPAATKGEGPIGAIVVAIGGLFIAYYMAKKLTSDD